jgi:hypothetical protein
MLVERQRQALDAVVLRYFPPSRDETVPVDLRVERTPNQGLVGGVTDPGDGLDESWLLEVPREQPVGRQAAGKLTQENHHRAEALDGLRGRGLGGGRFLGRSQPGFMGRG